MSYSIEFLERIMSEGMAHVECTVCGEAATIEPDADFLCPVCEIGRIVSPLVTEGLI